MVFCFNAINSDQGASQFYYPFDELEEGLEFLNRIVKHGDTLVSVHLLEDSQRTSLPVAAFDGIPFLPVLRKLEAEWTNLLSESPQLSIQVRRMNWYKKKLTFYEQHIINLEFLMNELSSYCEQRKHLPMGKDEIVIARYQFVLDRYGSQLNHAHSIRNVLLDRIYN